MWVIVAAYKGLVNNGSAITQHFRTRCIYDDLLVNEPKRRLATELLNNHRVSVLRFKQITRTRRKCVAYVISFIFISLILLFSGPVCLAGYSE